MTRRLLRQTVVDKEEQDEDAIRAMRVAVVVAEEEEEAESEPVITVMPRNEMLSSR